MGSMENKQANTCCVIGKEALNRVFLPYMV